MGRRKRGNRYYRVRLSDEDIYVLLALLRRALLELNDLPDEYRERGEVLLKKFREVRRWSREIWSRRFFKPIC